MIRTMNAGGRAASFGVAVGLVLASSACAPTLKTRASIERLPPACQNISVAIYFERLSATVTREARAVLRSAADMSRGCDVKSVRVIGLADAVGAADANQALSEERARNTTEALAVVGFTAPKFEVAAAGEGGALTPGGQAQPLRRRADVLVELAPLAR
jgi:peptidoglycan-associated lipoprotein